MQPVDMAYIERIVRPWTAGQRGMLLVPSLRHISYNASSSKGVYLMALTFKNVLPVPYRIVGNGKETVYDVTFDSSYLEGGEECTFGNLGLSVTLMNTTCTIRNSSELEANPVSGAFHKEEKLHLIDGKTAKEMASTKNMEAVVVRVEAHGI
jgi:hypothetical protein